MSDESKGGCGALAGAAIVLLLLVGAAGVYWLVRPLVQAGKARQAAALAAEEAERVQKYRARADADAIAAERAAAADQAAEVVQDAKRPVAEGEQGQTAESTGPSGGQTGAELDDAIRADVESVLRAQEAAWNRGDLDAFADGYWRSDEVTFSSGGKTTRGWEAMVAGYRERYPTQEKMGRLSFGNLEITPLAGEAALVLGEWKLDRESEPVNGNFSLVFRKLEGRWVIVHDHTSRAG